MKYIKNCKIITPDEIITGKAIAFGEKIIGFVDADEAAGEVIDAQGRYVAPGFVDVHIHGYLNADASDGDSEGIFRMAEGIAKNGVTSFLPTTMTISRAELDRALDSVRAVKEESKKWNGAEVLGVHAEGPFINPSKKGAQLEENIQKPDADFLINNADIIKLVTLAPEMEGGYECIKKVTENSSVVVSIGHTGATFEQALEGIDSGATHITHLFNAMTALAHRNPGVVGAALSRPVDCELIADTFHVHKGLFELLTSVKKEHLILITDCTRAGGMPDGQYELGGQPIFVKGIECRLEDGTIAGSVLKMNGAVRNILNNTSLDICKAVAMASEYPARSIGADNKGVLEIGRDADMIIIDNDINVYRTIRKGMTIYEA